MVTDQRARRVGESGAALLVVVGATSTLSVIASMLLLSALAAYEATGYRADREQARHLASAVLRQTHDALARAAIPLPARRHPVLVHNGWMTPGGVLVSVTTFPRPEPDWPTVTDSPGVTGSGELGVGASLRLEVVVGPRGDVRGPSSGAGSGLLIDATVTVWFRRAVVIRKGRFASLLDGTLKRLD